MIVMNQSDYLGKNTPTPAKKPAIKRFCAVTSNIILPTEFDETDEIDMSELNDFVAISRKAQNNLKQFAISFREYRKDKLRKPSVTFNYRIKQVIAWINKTKETKLATDIPILIDYLREYLTNYCTGIINSPDNVNIMTSLRLTRYLRDKKTGRILQRYLIRAKNELNNSGTISKRNQKFLWGAFNDFFCELLSGITDKINNKSVMKKDLLSQAIDTIKGIRNEDVVEEQESA